MNILVFAGYRNEKPVMDILDNGLVTPTQINAEPLTLRFDISQRYCTGWHNLETGESHACPESNAVAQKYEQCPACQRRTGFNPAFYHASSVSDQQEKRNREPHFLYLAYFSPSSIKIGISYTGRNHARLYEQGARAAMILETFPTALIARQYEADIAKMPGIIEHLTARKKREVLPIDYDQQTAFRVLANHAELIECALGVQFKSPEYIDLNTHYFFGISPRLIDVTDRTDAAHISGDVIGCIGTELLVQNDERILSLHLKHFTGYPLTLSRQIEPVDLPPVQASLF